MLVKGSKMSENNELYINQIRQKLNNEQNDSSIEYDIPTFDEAKETIKKAIKETIIPSISTSFIEIPNKWLFINDKSIYTTLGKNNSKLTDLEAIKHSNDLESMDLSCDFFCKQNEKIASFLGLICILLTFPFNIIALLINFIILSLIVLRLIKQIALCYGFKKSNDYLSKVLADKFKDITLYHLILALFLLIQKNIFKKSDYKIMSYINDLAESFEMKKWQVNVVYILLSLIVCVPCNRNLLSHIGENAKSYFQKKKLEQLGYLEKQQIRRLHSI